MLAIKSQAVGMTSEQQQFFIKLHDYIYNHEYAANGHDWAVMAQVDVEVRTAWFATPRSFDKTWVDHVITQRHLKALVVGASALSGNNSMHRQPFGDYPVSTNSWVRSHIQVPNRGKSEALDRRLPLSTGSAPFRSSTSALPNLWCWICKGTHQAAACQTQGKYAHYAQERHQIIRQSDGVSFCGGYNGRSGCKRNTCDRLHECITCGSSMHGAGDEVC